MTRDIFLSEGVLSWHRILTKVSERNSVENDSIEKLHSVDQAYTWLSSISIHIQITDFHWFEYFENGNIQGMVADFNLTCAEENQIIDTFDLSLLMLIRNCTSRNASDTIMKLIYTETHASRKHITVTGWSILDNLRRKYANKRIFNLMQLSSYFDICVTMNPSLKIQYLDHMCSKYIDYGEREYRECRAIYPYITRKTFEVVTKYQRHRINMLLKYLKFPEYQMEFIDLLSNKTLFELSNDDLLRMTSFDCFKDNLQQQKPSTRENSKAHEVLCDNNKFETTTPLNLAEDMCEHKDRVEDMETVTPYNITNEITHKVDSNDEIQTEVTRNDRRQSFYIGEQYAGQESKPNDYPKAEINGKHQTDDWMGDWFEAFM